MALTLKTAIDRLPTVANLTISNREAVESIKETYDSMNDYQKSFIATELKEKIDAYVTKMNELIKLDENSQGEDGDGEDSGSDETEGTESGDGQ